MTDKKLTDNQNNSDEIDLGRLFQIISNGLNKSFLRLFLYFKKNFVIIAGLGIFGLAIGMGLNKILTSYKKIDVFVKPNFGSRDYLYGVIDELQGKIGERDTLFFSNLGIDLEKITKFKIEISPSKSGTKTDLEKKLKTIKFLGDFKNNNSVEKVIKNEILPSLYNNPTISFYFSEGVYGRDVVQKTIKYINTNTYFVELKEIFLDNATQRIEENKTLIKQIDVLVKNYSKALGAKSGQTTGGGMVLLGGEQGMDIPALLNLKNELIESIENSKLQIKEDQEIVEILNFGQIQETEKSLFNFRLSLIPIILIGLFFLWSLLKHLNKKALQLS